MVSNVNTDRFLGILSVLVQAAFSFQGMELVAMYVLTCSCLFYNSSVPTVPPQKPVALGETSPRPFAVSFIVLSSSTYVLSAQCTIQDLIKSPTNYIDPWYSYYWHAHPLHRPGSPQRLRYRHRVPICHCHDKSGCQR